MELTHIVATERRVVTHLMRLLVDGSDVDACGKPDVRISRGDGVDVGA